MFDHASQRPLNTFTARSHRITVVFGRASTPVIAAVNRNHLGFNWIDVRFGA